MDTQKIIKYIIIGFVVIMIGFLIVWFFINQKVVSENNDFEDNEITTIFGRLFGGKRNIDVDTGIGIDMREEEKTLPRLRQLSEEPIAGFISFNNKDNETTIRYIRKATGHIYEAKTNSFTQKRVSNTTIPRVQESIWVDGSSTIIRYLDENNNIKSFYAEIIKTEDEESKIIDGKLEGVFLVDNMKEIIPLKNRLFYLLENINGSQGFTSDLSGKNLIKIFDSPLKEWLVERPKKGMLILTTKPSSVVNGYLYFYSVNKESMNKILSKIKGLTTLISNDTKNILFSKSLKDSVVLNLYNVDNEYYRQLILETLPEKCVWGSNNIKIYCGVPTILPKASYPDEWYQGLISFSDDIWKIDIKEKTMERIISPQEINNISLDIIKPKLSPDEKFLFFINKKDSSLWSFDLEEK